MHALHEYTNGFVFALLLPMVEAGVVLLGCLTLLAGDGGHLRDQPATWKVPVNTILQKSFILLSSVGLHEAVWQKPQAEATHLGCVNYNNLHMRFEDSPHLNMSLSYIIFNSHLAEEFLICR